MKSRFWLFLAILCGVYLLGWAALLVGAGSYTTPADVWKILNSREIRYSTLLSLTTCTVTAVLSVVVAVPMGYFMSRSRFPGHALVDAALDIPIVLPPMVVGICLLIFFQTAVGRFIESWMAFTYSIAGVVLAQWVISVAFAIRTMRGVFDHLSARPEKVALTLGCTPWQAFWYVTLPSARRGMWAALSIAWARSLGEFGPILVFAGATRMKTEVLPTSIWLTWSAGELEQGVAVSLLMIAVSMVVLVAIRLAGGRA